MSSAMTEIIRALIRNIPPGKVASYGQIAVAAGLPNGARQVVRILNASSAGEKLPWHRVVRKDGCIALPLGAGFELQKALLESEGVTVGPKGRIDLARFGHQFHQLL